MHFLCTHTHTLTLTHTHTHTHSHTHTERERHTHTHRHTHTGTHIDRQTHTHTHTFSMNISGQKLLCFLKVFSAHQSCIYFIQILYKLWNIITIQNRCFLCECVKLIYFCIFSIITAVFSVTWSSEIIIIYWFTAQDTFMIIINVVLHNIFV